jgi:hypothetical protein
MLKNYVIHQPCAVQIHVTACAEYFNLLLENMKKTFFKRLFLTVQRTAGNPRQLRAFSHVSAGPGGEGARAITPTSF